MGSKKKVNGMLIGEYAQKTIRELFMKKKISETEIKNLTKDDYCKIKFDLNYPMLKKSSESRKIRGYDRYYQDEITEGYWLTNDWYERNWDYLLKWESQKLIHSSSIYTDPSSYSN